MVNWTLQGPCFSELLYQELYWQSTYGSNIQHIWFSAAPLSGVESGIHIFVWDQIYHTRQNSNNYVTFTALISHGF